MTTTNEEPIILHKNPDDTMAVAHIYSLVMGGSRVDDSDAWGFTGRFIPRLGYTYTPADSADGSARRSGVRRWLYLLDRPIGYETIDGHLVASQHVVVSHGRHLDTLVALADEGGEILDMEGIWSTGSLVDHEAAMAEAFSGRFSTDGFGGTA